MAVPEQTPYIEYTANGVVTGFALGFNCESKDHLIVTLDGVEPPVGNWSLTDGEVVFTTAPSNDVLVVIQRNTPFSRTTDYQSYNNSFRPQSVNGDFDRLWLKLQELGVADWLMRLYVDRLHQQQEEKINNLKDYVDDRDDELRAYLIEEIRKQGVALDQLDEYYNYLMQRLAQIAVDKGWDASFIVDGDKSQQEINAISKSVVNVVELRNLRGVKNGDTVRTLGHTRIGLGGGTYTFEALSSKTDNNGSYIASSVASGTWVLVSDVHFENFGVIDGNTDQSAKITAAIDFCLDNGVRKISFEKSNTYYYDNYILIKPRLLNPSWASLPLTFEIDLNGALLKPMRSGLKLFIIGRDLVTFRNFNADAQSVVSGGAKADKDSVAFCLGLPDDLAAQYPRETYRHSVQHTAFYDPKASYFGEMFLFNPAWSVYYSHFENPVAHATYYMFSFAANMTSRFDQVTRSTIINPKHVGGTCTFYCNCVETTKSFGGAAEFITYEDVYGRMSVPTAIYEPQESEGAVTGATQQHNVFIDFDIEVCRAFVNMSGLHSDWRGRALSIKDVNDNTLNTPEAYRDAIKGRCFEGWLGWKKGAYATQTIENFGGRDASLQFVTYKAGESLSIADISHALNIYNTANYLRFAASGDSLGATYKILFDSTIKQVESQLFKSPKISTSTIQASSGTRVYFSNAVANGCDLFIDIPSAGGITTLGSYDLSQAVRGNLNLDALNAIQPSRDSAISLGTASNRFSVVYASTSAINTSDEREKQQIRDLSEAEKRVAIKLKSQIRAFKFNDAVELKGDGARIHFGVIAQEVKAAFESEGLVAEDYAILCYDEWEAEYRDITEEITVTNDAGEEVTEMVETGERELIREAGNRYGVRYEELLAFIISAI